MLCVLYDIGVSASSVTDNKEQETIQTDSKPERDLKTRQMTQQGRKDWAAGRRLNKEDIVWCGIASGTDEMYRPLRTYEIPKLVRLTIRWSEQLNEFFSLPYDRNSRYKSWHVINPRVPKFHEIPEFLARIINSTRFNLRPLAQVRLFGIILVFNSLMLWLVLEVHYALWVLLFVVGAYMIWHNSALFLHEQYITL